MHLHSTRLGLSVSAALARRVISATVTALVLALLPLPRASAADDSVTVSKAITAGARTGLYVPNREPLVPSALQKLPPGSIVPRGWLRSMLLLETQGMTGRLAEISPWLKFEASAWADKEGKGSSGWEEMPYWLKGYGDLGYVLGDEKIIAEARRWIDAALASRTPDGWFGPRELQKSLDGKPDLWPHMVMLNVFQSFHEFTGDPRVIECMSAYFRWQDKLPPETFGAGYWPKLRAGDNIESIAWLYNRTGGTWLLALAKKIHENMAPWRTDVIDWHNVNIAQGFRAPAMYFPFGGDAKLLDAAERNYAKVMGTYGQFAGGGFGADENARPGFYDPRQGFETCGIVEFMHSFQLLSRISGTPLWADRSEEIAFNSMPASMTPDLKALHYLTGANMVQLDRLNKSPGLQNGGTMLSYSPFACYRCCQHNVSHGWPYYAEELWLATWDGGLLASLYAASEVKAKVGDGTEIAIAEETEYPFEETVRFRVGTPKDVDFPLYLRIPRWCSRASIEVAGKGGKMELPKAEASSFVRIQRTWSDGDEVVLRLPMEVRLRTWPKNKDAVSVDRGPLTYSLKIGENWVRYGGTDPWPEIEVYPTTPWNYGLVIDPVDPAKSFQFVRKTGPLAAQPFTPEAVPVALSARAQKIPAWQQDRLGLVGLLQPSPVRSEEPEEIVTLIPMGAARLRISSFPTIGSGPDAHEWVPPQKPCAWKATASHCHDGDTTDALCDGISPSASNDPSIPRFTWWPRKGTKEWVAYEFEKPRKVSQVSVYWFDDEGGGGCRVPAGWTLLYRAGDSWKPVEAKGAYGVHRDEANPVEFEPVETNGLRLEVQLKPEFSGGVLEWKVQ